MDERDPIIERAAATLRAPVRLDPGLDRRVMAEIERLPAPRAGAWWAWAALRWLRRGRTVTVSPLGGLGLATAIAILLVVQWWWLAPADQPRQTLPPHAESVQFVLVAPGASAVTLVGDFNDWSTSATPMQTVPGNGVWMVTVPLEPGRYRYAFMVDGATWMRDPTAPPALEDDFGRPNSVVTVRGS